MKIKKFVNSKDSRVVVFYRSHYSSMKYAAALVAAFAPSATAVIT